jgi:hypothetical protein
MPTRALLLSLFLLLLAAAPASATIVPGKGIAGVELGDCQQRAIDVLGPPDRTFGSTDFAGFKSAYTYIQRGLRLEFRRGPGECLELTSIRTTKGEERTKEGVGQGTTRKTLRARLKREKCRTFRSPRSLTRICWLGSFTPSKPVTEFRINRKRRVASVRVAIVID